MLFLLSAKWFLKWMHNFNFIPVSPFSPNQGHSIVYDTLPRSCESNASVVIGDSFPLLCVVRARLDDIKKWRDQPYTKPCSTGRAGRRGGLPPKVRSTFICRLCLWNRVWCKVCPSTFLCRLNGPLDWRIMGLIAPFAIKQILNNSRVSLLKVAGHL